MQAISLTAAQEVQLAALPGVSDGRLGTQGTGTTVEETAVAEGVVQSLGDWKELVGVTTMGGGFEGTSVTKCPVSKATSDTVGRITHVRLNYWPDGGVARLKLFGHVAYDYTADVAAGTVMDLASAGVGGKGIVWSNEHYGVPSNLLQPGRGINMGDGWETARHPHRAERIEIDPTTGISTSVLSDWCVLKLGRPTHSVTEVSMPVLCWFTPSVDPLLHPLYTLHTS